MKYQEQFLTIWDTPAKPARANASEAKKAEKSRVALMKSLAIFLPGAAKR